MICDCLGIHLARNVASDEIQLDNADLGGAA